MFDIVGEVLQVLTLLVGLIIAVFKGIPAIKKAIQEFDKDETSADEDRQTDQSPKRMYIDLALVLICAAIFSMILIDALVLSGRNDPTWPYSFSITVVITTVTTATLVFMWFIGKPELGIGWLAILTIVVIIFAPGGPLLIGDEGSEEMDLWLPMILLVFLSVTMVIYEYGYPLDKTLPRSRRIGLFIALVMIILSATLSLGRQIQKSILASNKTPEISLEGVSYLIETTDGWSVSHRRTFYSAFSETHLADDYEQSAAVFSPNTDLTTDSTIPVSLRTWLEIEEGYSTTEAEEITAIIIEGGQNAEVREYLITYTNTSNYSAEDDSKKIIAKYNQLNGTGTLNPKLLRLQQYIDFFSFLQPEDQLNYLANRLLWIHPVGAPEQDLSPINLPGNTASQRKRSLENRRISYSLKKLQPQLREELLNQFAFDLSIEDEFNNQIDYGEEFEVQQNALFYELNVRFLADPLQEQLCLPDEDEEYVAFQQYELLARNILITEFLNVDYEIEKGVVAEIFKDIDNLDSKSNEAFIYYFSKESNEGDNFEAVSLLAENSIDFATLNDENVQNAVQILIGVLQTPETIEGIPSPLYETASALVALQDEDPDGGELILDLLKSQAPNIPLRHLLNEDVMMIVKNLDNELREDERNEIFKVLIDPISKVMPEIIRSENLTNIEDLEAEYETKDRAKYPSFENYKDDFHGIVLSAFDNFNKLDAKGKENFLQQVAISLYRKDGEYSPDIFSLSVAQASNSSSGVAGLLAGLLVASLLSLGFIIISVVLASYAARRLAARDKLRDLILAEASQDKGRYAIGTPSPIRGRTALIEKLKGLSGRGWSAIAVVGRRGVGKTRILYELNQTDQNDNHPTSVTAWISAASKFEETEVIESIFERLTSDVERVIAKCLGAKPLEVRRLEVKETIAGSVIYAIFVIILGWISIYMLDRADTPQLRSSWLPVIIIVALSSAILLTHITRLQPVNLSSWLERDRSNSPQTVLLYREARRAQSYLNNRKDFTSNSIFGYQLGNYIRLSAIVIVSGALLFLLFFSLFGLGQYVELMLILGVILVGLLIARPRNTVIDTGYSLMSLISKYREFVEMVVYRIKRGALGERIDNDFEVIICIDEMDKIIDAEELRNSLRRMKTIFEIPGAYYYLSLAEDALKTLYLGSVGGKNEIDSTFDHIVHVPPLDCDLGEEIVGAYLERHIGPLFWVNLSDELENFLNFEQVPDDLRQQFVENKNPLSEHATVLIKMEKRSWLIIDEEKSYTIRKTDNRLNISRASRLNRIIAAVAFGVPRDIIRRCDELLASGYLPYQEPWTISNEFRQRQADLAYGENLLTKNERIKFSDEARLAAEEIRKYFEIELSDEDELSDEKKKSAKVLLSLWVLALISIAVKNPDEIWDKWSEDLRDIGYRILDEPVENLVEELKETHNKIFGIT